MTRTSTILSILAALALVLAGAWWIGAAPEAENGAPLDVARDEPEAGSEPGPELALDGLADGDELDSPERVALLERETAEDSPAVGVERGGAWIARGTLVDAATGEPLPDYRFELLDSGKDNVFVTTDGEGAFETTKRLLPGEIRARFLEASRDLVSVGELRAGPDADAEPLALRVASGPTYRVELAPADAPPLEEHSIWLALDNGRGRFRGVARSGDPRLVRFAPFPVGTEVAGTAKIVVESRDGVWRGARGVALGIGRQARAVVIELEALAALEVRVVDPEGSALENAVVSWTIPSGGNPREASTRKDGVAVFERIQAEIGTVRVRLVRWRELEMPLTLVQGVRRVETITLTRAPSAGSIRGTIVSDSGAYERKVSMRLVPLDLGRGVRSLDARVVWTTKSGARVGRFDFDDLPAGRFRLEVSENDFYAWEPRRIELEAPREDVLVVVKDAVAVADLAFEPREEDGTAFTGSFEVRLAALGETRVFGGQDGILVLPQFPVDAPLRWRIDASGRAASFGAWPELAPLPSVAGRERRGAAPVLPRGWAQLYRVVRSDNRKPIEDALAVVDGREAGRTDALGRIVLRADARPGKVVFRWKDWRVADRIDTTPLRQGSNDFERTVRMEAPKNAPKNANRKP